MDAGPGLDVRVDRIGNVVATRAGADDGLDAVMVGSHVDTVRTGGRYDGALGVLAGLEVVRALDDAGVRTRRPLAVAFFTDEEGSRFAPDMLGSLVYVGGMPLEDALDVVGVDGAVLGDELERIGWAGDAAVPGRRPRLRRAPHRAGPAARGAGRHHRRGHRVQGISWQELTLTGQANHAGTTPMRLRRDAGYVAASVVTFVRRLARDLGGHQVGTVGRLDLHPDLVNVVAVRATLTVDLRNTDDSVLAEAEWRLREYVAGVAEDEGSRWRGAAWPASSRWPSTRRWSTWWSGPTTRQGHTVLRLPSGAGHDAQMFARVCPTGMVFVPSRGGVSHNPAEYTAPHDLEAGARVLAEVLVELAG